MDDSDNPAQHRILIVDDNRDAAEMLGALLEMRGATIRVEFNAEDALKAIAAFDPCLLLIDLGMPDIDGFELARRLSERPERVRQILVAVTGWGDQRHRQRSKEAGFDRHLLKPVRLQEILSILDSCAALRPA